MFDRSQQWRRRARLGRRAWPWPRRRSPRAARARRATRATQTAAGGGNVTLTLKHITDNRARVHEADRGVQEGRPERHDQAELRAGGRSADVAARAARRRQRARPVRRLAGQRLGDVGAAARARGRARGHLRPGVDQERPREPAPLLGNDGKTYMYSSGVTPIGAIYNKKVLADAGVDRAAEDVGRAAGDLRQGQGRGQDVHRARQPDAVDHAADPVRDRAVDGVQGGPEPRAGHARRQEDVLELGLAHRLRALPRARQEGRLQQEPERHDVRAAAGDGRQRQGGDGDPGHERRDRHPATRRRTRPTSRRSRSPPPTARPT